MRNLKISFIGGGNMAEALLAGLVRAGHAPEQLTVADVRADRVDELKKNYGVRGAQSNAEAAMGSDALLLAVKPQQMDAALKSIMGKIAKETTVISIAAGISIKHLREGLGDEACLVRVMPNTPCLIGAGMSVLFCGSGEDHCARAEYILSSSGKTAWVDDEDMLHAVTAISGSGPAYFFLLAELMQAAARALGLPKELSGVLVTQTALGAGRMLVESGKTAEELRQQVTSPGGTTQAALETMFEANMPDAVRAAIAAAARRSKALV